MVHQLLESNISPLSGINTFLTTRTRIDHTRTYVATQAQHHAARWDVVGDEVIHNGTVTQKASDANDGCAGVYVAYCDISVWL